MIRKARSFSNNAASAAALAMWFQRGSGSGKIWSGEDNF